MEKITRRSLLSLPALAPLSLGILGEIQKQEPNRKTPDNEQAQRAREKIRRRYFPDVTLTTHQGKKVQFYEDLIKDKSVLLNMMYTNCEGVCPGITANLVRVQKLLGDRVGRD